MSRGDAIRAALAGPTASVDWTAAIREFHEMGWRRDATRPESAAALIQDKPYLLEHLRGRESIFPWWISPTGESIRGMRQGMALAVAEPPQEPSPMAQRLLTALSQHPGLREEMQGLLKT